MKYFFQGKISNLKEFPNNPVATIISRRTTSRPAQRPCTRSGKVCLVRLTLSERSMETKNKKPWADAVQHLVTPELYATRESCAPAMTRRTPMSGGIKWRGTCKRKGPIPPNTYNRREWVYRTIFVCHIYYLSASFSSCPPSRDRRD